MFCKKGVLRNFAKFTGKHLRQSLFFNKVEGFRPATLLKKRLWHRCFPVNFVKFLRAPFFIDHLWTTASAIDTLINCFQSHECIWNVTSGDYEDQNRKSLPLEEFDMSVQKYNINRYDYKKWNNLQGQFLLLS